MKKSVLQNLINEEVERALMDEGFFGDLAYKAKLGAAKNYIRTTMPDMPDNEIEELAGAFATGGIKAAMEKKKEIKAAKSTRPVGRPKKDAAPPQKRGRKAGSGWSDQERETRAQSAARRKQEKMASQKSSDEAEAARLSLQNERERQRQLQRQRNQKSRTQPQTQEK